MEEEKKKLTGRGGAGRGQGRKPKGSEYGALRFSFRCSKDVWDILQQQEDKTAFVEDAIREKKRREVMYRY